jgi:hypothetical protein
MAGLKASGAGIRLSDFSKGISSLVVVTLQPGELPRFGPQYHMIGVNLPW